MKGGYDPSHYPDLYAVEDRHFWFRGRNRMIEHLAAQAVLRLPRGYRVLEVGCGDGNVLRLLEQTCKGGTVIGMDYFAEGLELARTRCRCLLVQGDLARPPFAAEFHLACAFDVLEHLPDDGGALRSLWRMLQPGGRVLATVPAQPSLWSDFDVASGHCRRYQQNELLRKLEDAGFTVEFLTPFMTSIYPLVRLSRALRHSRDKETGVRDAVRRELRIVPVLNDVLAFLLEQEARWTRRGRTLPIGTSLAAVAQKCG
jgi:SAM-dependent methyltransferase